MAPSQPGDSRRITTRRLSQMRRLACSFPSPFLSTLTSLHIRPFHPAFPCFLAGTGTGVESSSSSNGSSNSSNPSSFTCPSAHEDVRFLLMGGQM